ncbi:MAG: hypothetical protein R6U91_02050 [Bacillota bacterium]
MVKTNYELLETDDFKVTVNLLGFLKEIYPHLEEQTSLELNRPVTVVEVIETLGVSSKMVLFATIEDRQVAKEDTIEGSCELNLISPPAGG